ncbi:anti-sigma factor [Streptomyces asoensis]|uniref:anti-sigma factor n=1 Tax=Streptomyces asoensis TaxID=249586 RepID=UPI0033315CB9
MEHLDEETLAAMALGESPPSSSATQHLSRCDRCRRQLDAYAYVITTAKSTSVPDDELLEPPAGLWESIAEELHIAPHHEHPADPGHGTHRPSPPHETRRHLSAADDTRQGGATATSAARRSRRTGRFAVTLAACAALLGAGAGSAITWWATQNSATSAPAATDGSRLDSLRTGSTGYARLDESDGHRTLDVAVKGLPPNPGYFEVWLMDRSHTRLISMGVLGPDGRAALPVPDNVDLSDYSVVDVSVQPYNGKPDHSGDSIVRGPYAG